MPKWSNWSGRLSHKPDSYQQIYSEQQAAALAAYCQQQGQSIRAVGAGHSHQDLVGNDGVIVDLVGLSGVSLAPPRTRLGYGLAVASIHWAWPCISTAWHYLTKAT